MGWFYTTEEGEIYNSCLLYTSSHLPGHLHSELGKYYTLGAGHDPTAGAAGVLGALEWPEPVE